MAAAGLVPKAKFFVTTWGVLDVAGGPHKLSDLPKVLAKVKSLGYDGIEAPVAVAMEYGTTAFKAALKEAGLQYIAMVFSSGGAPTPGNANLKSEIGLVHLKDSSDTRDVKRHFDVWSAQILEALAFGDSLVQITSHTGKDYFNTKEADELLSMCTAFEKEHKARVNHETHRSRILYSPWTTHEIAARHPDLHLCADFSHFCCVSEADHTDKELNAAIAKLTPRIRHVHARTGFNEGPQVPDVRGKTWQPLFEGHQKWWSDIFTDFSTRHGESFITITPEHGPTPYQWTTPYDDKPVTNVWDENHFVGLTLCRSYAARFGASNSGSLVPDPDHPETV